MPRFAAVLLKRPMKFELERASVGEPAEAERRKRKRSESHERKGKMPRPTSVASERRGFAGSCVRSVAETAAGVRAEWRTRRQRLKFVGPALYPQHRDGKEQVRDQRVCV